ncbi:MAG: SDR family oxidoreductase [Cyanobacteria bacterium P01_G01_bin.54]
MNNRAVLITGANRGIGLQFVRAFIAEGWQVIACCRHPDHAADLIALQEDNPTLEIYALDVTNHAQISQLSAQLKNRKIDILLSNAGITGPKAIFGHLDMAAWREVLEVNAIAPLILAQNFVEQVAASETKLMVMIGSKMGSIDDNSSGGAYFYRSSKSALNQVVKSLSIDLADRGIAAVILNPGWVQTDMGGINASTTVKDSVAGMMQHLKTARARNGAFIDLDGTVIPW